MRGVLVLCLFPAWTHAAQWEVEPQHSTLAFTASWEGEPFEGVFRRFDAKIDFDPKTPERGRFLVSLDVTSADLGSEDLYEGMGEQDWFDFPHFPRATFTTSAIRALGEDRYLAEGQLSLKGIAQPVKLRFSWTGQGARGSMHGDADLLRTDFGIGTGEWAQSDEIGRRVRVRVDLRLRRLGPG